MADEFARIAEIKRRLEFGRPDIVLGIGDDAAVLAASSNAQVLSVDTQVEGVHFLREWLSGADIGYRAAAAALSDLAAMGAEPRALLCALCVPAALSDEQLYAIIDGIAEAQREYGVATIGGNLARASELSLTTTVIGECAQPCLTRSGARPGDGLYVTGALGEAALGLRLLQRGRAALEPTCVSRWRRPKARIREGRALLGVASAAIDISDGFLQDLAHVAAASNVGFELERERLPSAEVFERAARELGEDPLALALTGGEDYELLFTSAAPSALGTRIGTATASSGLRLLDARGHELELPAHARGFDHFASR